MLPLLPALLAQASEALEAAGQAERLGLIGVLALFVIALVFGFLTERIVSGSQYARMRDERDAALAENGRLRSMYDKVLVLAAQSNSAAAEELRRLTERHE